MVSPEVESHAPSGVPIGAESGHAYRTMPGPVRSMYTAPYGVFAIEDYEAKYYTLLRLAAGQNISCIATVNPSTIVLLADRLARHTESIIRDVRDGSLSSEFAVPAGAAGLAAPATGPRARQAPGAGGGRRRRLAAARAGLARSWPRSAAGRAGPSAPTWRSSTPTSPSDRRSGTSATTPPSCAARCRSATRATPGPSRSAPTCSSSTPPDEDRAPEGRELLRVEQLEVGQRYFVYVTNASGLYRYEMNDIVEVAGHDRQTPLIRFIQKGKGVVSFTGEKLYEVQVIAAVDKALAALRGRYHFIAAVAELVDGTSPRLDLPDRVRRRRSPTMTVRRWWTASTRPLGRRTTSTSPSGSRCATAPR